MYRTDSSDGLVDFIYAGGRPSRTPMNYPEFLSLFKSSRNQPGGGEPYSTVVLIQYRVQYRRAMVHHDQVCWSRVGRSVAARKVQYVTVEGCVPQFSRTGALKRAN
jgi:hypothetical protein